MKRTYIAQAKQNRSIFFKVGLILSLGAVILAFRWSVVPKAEDISYIMEDLEQVVEIIPRTVQEKKQVLPPPVVEALEEIIPEDLEVEFAEELLPEKLEEAVSADPKVERVDQPSLKEPVKNIPLPMPKEEDENIPEIFKLVEEVPVFGGCEKLKDKKERKVCSDRAIFKFLSENIRYPAIARENGIEGTAIIQFIIDENGSVSNAKIVRDVPGGCGAEALKVIQSMPNWRPGIQRHQKVKVQMNVPVKFKLN